MRHTMLVMAGLSVMVLLYPLTVQAGRCGGSLCEKNCDNTLKYCRTDIKTQENGDKRICLAQARKEKMECRADKIRYLDACLGGCPDESQVQECRDFELNEAALCLADAKDLATTCKTEAEANIDRELPRCRDDHVLCLAQCGP